MRIRYTNDVDIRVEYPHNLPTQVSIPPLLLIVFVENAFKHGVSYNNPSFIHMQDVYKRQDFIDSLKYCLFASSLLFVLLILMIKITITAKTINTT